MGINVTGDKKVSFDSSHERFVVTGNEKNPTQIKFNGMQVSFVFRRIMSKSRTNDGNPLIYAFKGLQGYTITSREVGKFIPDFRIILRKILSDTHYDLVLPMPSKHGISSILAKRVLKHQRTGEVKKDFIRKKTNGEVLAELKGIASKKHHKEIIALRKKLETEAAGHTFSMKDVHKSLRSMISPMTSSHISTVGITKVLLVDDLMSSGSTLKSAYHVVKGACPDAQIDALCLLSHVTSH